MHIHEYQAKQLLQKFGIPIPPFAVASNRSEVERAIEELNLERAIVKVQVHAGGRGKAGGVKDAKSKKEILEVSKDLLGKKIINNQTGPDGLVSSAILLTAPVEIKKEYYLAALLDRKVGAGVIIASREGGIDIEEKPESIHKEIIPPSGKLYSFQLFALAKALGWTGETRKQGMQLIASLASLFQASDASLFEINPLIETPNGELYALDAKATIDDNALFRQKEIASYRDPTQLPQNEVLAGEYDLAYVGLKGEIGCMVNGAGLAMATMDMIHLYGGRPANFLDVGGSASKEKIAHGFKIILSDSEVRAIFVNIFGGIMDCAVLASGLVAATKEMQLNCPLIVRMEGTNVEQGKKILHDSGLKIQSAETMDEGARLAVEAAKT
jgi:succinyl-CoA synthetase beta subunit